MIRGAPAQDSLDVDATVLDLAAALRIGYAVQLADRLVCVGCLRRGLEGDVLVARRDGGWACPRGHVRILPEAI